MYAYTLRQAKQPLDESTTTVQLLDQGRCVCGLFKKMF